MQALIAGIVAAFVGILLGFLLRAASAKAEQAQLQQRIQEQAGELVTARAELTQTQAESAVRASFQALATERQGAVARLEEERNALREELRAKAEAETAHTARISQLEADLRNLRQNLADQAALYDSTRQTLAVERAETVARLEKERNTLREELRVKTETERDQAARVSKLQAELNNERENLAEKLSLLENAKQALAHQFEALASDILDKKSKSFAEGNQKELGTLLTPLRDQIKEFRDKVEQAQTDSKTGVTKLETLIGALGGLNQQLSKEAHNLSTALRGSSKAQGDWGEFILRDLLEKAGLREGEEFSFQQAFPSMEIDGERIKSPRTDVIVSMPGGRHLVIDSKVSLNSYADSVNAETEEARRAALAEHLKSVRKHIGTLSKAGYHALPGIESPDFVVMFVPVEPAFLVALQSDESLWADAYKQGILLVGPTTLLYVIRIVSVLWQQEVQARSVQDVMTRGAELYDKFVGFVADLEAVGRSLRGADASYSNAMKKLSEGRGNLIRQVEMLKGLGIRTSKQMPRGLLDAADVEELGLALAAEAEEDPSQG
jgi:DNA recombination protein RmuC